MPIAFNQRVVPLAQSPSGFGASMRLAYDLTETDSRPLWQAYDHQGETNPALVPTGTSVSVTNNGIPGRRAGGTFGATYVSASDFGLHVGTGDYTLAVLFSTPSSLPTVTGVSTPIRIDNNGTNMLHQIDVSQYTGGWGVGATGNVGTNQSMSFIPVNARVAFFIRRIAGVVTAFRYVIGVDSAPGIKHAALSNNTTDWNATTAQRVSVLAYGNTGNYSDQVAVHSIRFHNVGLSDAELKLYADDWWAVDNSASDVIAPVLSGNLTVGGKTNSTINVTIPTASDNIGVAGYQYRVNSGAWQSNGTSTGISLTGLLPLTSYNIEARAFDSAGNYSNILSVTTSTYRAGATGSFIRNNTGPINGNPGGIMYNDVAGDGSDDAKWFSFRLITSPATGTLTISPNGTFSFNGPQAESFTYQLEVDGADVGSPVTVTLYGATGNPTININSVSVDEGVGTASLNVSLSSSSTSAITVNYATADGTATAGSDYVATSGTLTFAAGETTKQISVLITDDAAQEGNETILVNLTSPTNATLGMSQGIITISANDVPAQPSISISNTSVAEGVGTANLSVSLSAPSASVITVSYATANGTATAGNDYVATSGTLTFAAGETSKQISVTITDDATQESDETILVNLSSPVNATLGTAQGIITINSNDVPALPIISIGNVNVAESAGVASLIVSLSASSASVVTVNYTTANGTAVSGSDYAPGSGTITFSPGETSKLITISILDDATQEPNETILVNLSSPSNATLGNTQGIITINASDLPVHLSGRVFVKEAGIYVPAAIFSKTAGAYNIAGLKVKLSGAYVD